MSKQFFIQILRDYLNGRVTVLPESVDWNTVRRLSRLHQVDGIVFSQCKRLMPSEVFNRFQSDYFGTISAHIKRKNSLNCMKLLFRENKIPFFVVKGETIKEYYPEPALRTMGDVDVVVHSKDRDAAHELLVRNGFTNVNHHRDQSWHYSNNGFTYELHDRLVYDEEINYLALRSFFNSCWKYVNQEELDVSFHFMFLLVHLRTHLMGCGVGFRQFMDIAVMDKEEKRLNWAWIEEQLIELGLMPFAATCFALIENWFGIETPLEKKELDEGFCCSATESILNGGVFGGQNPDSVQNIVINTARGRSLPRVALIRRALSTAFPSYRKLSGNDHYRFIDGKPYLLPVAWGYRICRGSRMITHGKFALRFLLPSKDAIIKRDQFLRDWGL